VFVPGIDFFLFTLWVNRAERGDFKKTATAWIRIHRMKRMGRIKKGIRSESVGSRKGLEKADKG